MHAEKQVTLKNKEGLHARPAALLVQAAGQFSSEVQVVKEGFPPANAKSILAILSLGVEQGQSVMLRAVGEDAEEAVRCLSALVEGGLGEG